MNELKSTDKATSFDSTIQQLKYDPNAMTSYVVDLLDTQINANLKDEILYYRRIEALYSIISIMFNDQTKVEIFVQIRTTENHSQDNSNSPSNSQEEIHGVRKTTDWDDEVERSEI